MNQPVRLDPRMTGEVLNVMRDLAEARSNDGCRHACYEFCALRVANKVHVFAEKVACLKAVRRIRFLIILLKQERPRL